MSTSQATQRSSTPLWENIPHNLTTTDQWVLWRNVDRDGKRTKLPCQVDGNAASSIDRHTWATYGAVKAAYLSSDLYTGIGFVLATEDPFVAADFDSCVENGRIVDPRIARFVKRLDSYSEFSPSGRGLRVFIRGVLPPQDRRLGKIEIYQDKRFVSVTGRHVPGTPSGVHDRQAALDAFHAEVFAVRVARRQVAQFWPQSIRSTCYDGDASLLKRARIARNGSRFVALFDHGAWQTEGFPSQSEADLWLVARLLFWTDGDVARTDRLFRQSGLMRSKWDRPDYRERTLEATAHA